MRERGLALAWVTGPLAVLRGPALWIISSAHAGVRGPLALPGGVGVTHFCPGVPHVALGSISRASRTSWAPPSHHGVLWGCLASRLHALSAVGIRVLALDGSALHKTSTVLPVHICLLPAVLLHPIGLTLMSFSRRAIHPLNRPLIALRRNTLHYITIQVYHSSDRSQQCPVKESPHYQAYYTTKLRHIGVTSNNQKSTNYEHLFLAE